MKKPRVNKPTPNMLWLLEKLAKGHPANVGCHSQSDYGGRACSLTALLRRGWIDDDHKVTADGHMALAVFGGR